MRNDPRRIFGLGPFGVFGLALLMTSSLLAAVDDPLALVPDGAAAVGVVRLGDLRTNPLSSRLFRDFDRHLADGDAARFLEEANLDPKKDVDVIMVAGSPKGSGHGEGLIVFQGRFEPERLSAAAVLRGAVRKSTPDGPYFLLPDKRKGKDEEGEAAHRHEPGAVAFVSARLVMAGPELSVKKALADLSAGGTGFLKGDGIGKERGRIDRKAAIWALADASRLPDREPRKGAGDAVQGLASAMRSVTF